MHKKKYTDAFTHRGFYAKKEVFTQMFRTKMFLRAKIKTYWCFYTEPLPQRNLCTEQCLHFTHVFSTQKTFDTEKLVHTDCTQKFLQTVFFTRRNFTQSSFYTTIFFFAQKPLRTKVMRRSFYRHTYDIRFLHRKLSAQKSYAQKVLRTILLYIQTLLHTDAFTQTQIAHIAYKNLCTQHAFNTVNFYTERLCFLFLITYLSCSSSQVMIAFCWENDGVTG